jgi:hypothetical protein
MQLKRSYIMATTNDSTLANDKIGKATKASAKIVGSLPGKHPKGVTSGIKTAAPQAITDKEAELIAVYRLMPPMKREQLKLDIEYLADSRDIALRYGQDADAELDTLRRLSPVYAALIANLKELLPEDVAVWMAQIRAAAASRNVHSLSQRNNPGLPDVPSVG